MKHEDLTSDHCVPASDGHGMARRPAASRTLAPRVQPRFAAQNDDELTKAITDLLGPFEGKKPKDAPAEPAPAPAPAAAPAEDSD